MNAFVILIVNRISVWEDLDYRLPSDEMYATSIIMKEVKVEANLP